MKIAITIASLILVFVYFLSSLLKLIDKQKTIIQIRRLGLNFFNEKIFYILVLSEFTTAILLLFMPRLGSMLSVLLLSAFTTILYQAWRRKTSLNCACFGVFSNSKITINTIIRNLFLLALSIFIAISV